MRRHWAVLAVGFGVSVLVIAWHAASLRLELQGENLAWATLVAFGFAWARGPQEAGRSGAGMFLGVTWSVLAIYGALRFLPITPFGTALALGAAAVVLGAIVLGTRVVHFGSCVLGYGIGIAFVQIVGIGVSTGAADVVALLTSVGLATIIGLIGVRALSLLLGPEVEEAEPVLPIEESPEEALVIEASPSRRRALSRPRRRTTTAENVPESVDLEETFGPLLQPPQRVTTRRAR
jgi:hypothetical protein